MRGFWKTGKELSDRAEISRISSWALGDLNLWISARSDNVKGGWGWGVKISARFSPWRKSRRGMKFGRFLSWSSGYENASLPIPLRPLETEDRLTLSWFASLKRHECASLIMKREITNATAQTHWKKRKTEGEKEDCFPTLVINIDKHLNKALTLLIHTITQVKQHSHTQSTIKNNPWTGSRVVKYKLSFTKQ